MRACCCVWRGDSGDIGLCVVGVLVVLTRHTDTEIDMILKHLLMAALRLQLQHHSLSPIRLSIIHVSDFMGFSGYFRLY